MTGTLKLKSLQEVNIKPSPGMFVFSPAGDFIGDIFAEVYDYARVETRQGKFIAGPIIDLDQFKANDYNDFAKILIVKFDSNVCR